MRQQTSSFLRRHSLLELLDGYADRQVVQHLDFRLDRYDDGGLPLFEDQRPREHGSSGQGVTVVYRRLLEGSRGGQINVSRFADADLRLDPRVAPLEVMSPGLILAGEAPGHDLTAGIRHQAAIQLFVDGFEGLL